MKKILLALTFLILLPPNGLAQDFEGNPNHVSLKLDRTKFHIKDFAHVKIHNSSQKSIWVQNGCFSPVRLLRKNSNSNWEFQEPFVVEDCRYVPFIEIKPDSKLEQVINFAEFPSPLEGGTYKFYVEYCTQFPDPNVLGAGQRILYSAYSPEFIVFDFYQIVEVVEGNLLRLTDGKIVKLIGTFIPDDLAIRRRRLRLHATLLKAMVLDWNLTLNGPMNKAIFWRMSFFHL